MAFLTADGLQLSKGVIASDSCCPPCSLAMDVCARACAFIQLLPSGTLWDRAKTEALSYYGSSNGTNPCEATCPPADLTCQSMVAYAVYVSRVLGDLLQNALGVSLQEANPRTAVVTLDDWLVRLGWQDCYATQCRSVLLGELTPYEIMGECGPIFCPVDTPADLACAVKQGIVRSLTRAQMGGIKNLAWLQWVVEPLGATITPRNLPADCGADYPGKCKCVGMQFNICHTSTTLPGCIDSQTASGCASVSVPQVTAFIDLRDCDKPAGMPSQIWPGIIAAECIIRSLLPVSCEKNIFRCC